METLIITKNDIAEILTPSAAIAAVQKAFKAHGMKQAYMPEKSYLRFKKGGLSAMPAYIHGQGLDIAGIKSANRHPENAKHNLPPVMGIITLIDPKNGFPLAILDCVHITSIRTGATGALAARLLSRKNAKVAGFVGCGAQARTNLACTMEVRKLNLVKVWQHNRKSDSARNFCSWAEETFNVGTAISSDIDEVTTQVDILVTTTPSRKPIVNEISPGTHINAFGADAPGKQEINPRILKQAKLVVDDRTQASYGGEINVPLHRRQIFKKHIYGELGEIVAGKKDGRISDQEITVFDSTGLAIQDISCAYAVYAQLKEKEEFTRINFF